MSTRRALLAAAAGVLVVGADGAPSLAPHPDAALLVLCARLEEMQAEWQRLYDLTSEEDELTTAADHAWQTYSAELWPGLRLSPWSRKERDPVDIPGRLVDLPATTSEGLRAKAAAVLALDEAAGYLTDCRNDSAELWQSVSGTGDKAPAFIRLLPAGTPPLAISRLFPRPDALDGGARSRARGSPRPAVPIRAALRPDGILEVSRPMARSNPN